MIIEEINILRQHGWQFIPDPRTAVVPAPFRGRPEIQDKVSLEVQQELYDLCPVAAIGMNPLSIDLGKCYFCGECAMAHPQAIQFTNDHRLATNDRKRLIVAAGDTRGIELDPNKIRKEITAMFGRSLKLRQISAAGENSHEAELNACGNVNFDMGRYGIEFVASPRHADGIVITGPISQNMAEATEICYHAVPDPKIVVLVGSDAISGGIFAGSGALNRSFLDKVSIDLYVPGNPPHPLTFINGILALSRSRA
jgi:hypothetical protein